MAEKTDSPQAIVANACIALADAIIARHSLMTIDDARHVGRGLFDWFVSRDAVTATNAPIAARCTESGTTLIKDKHSITVQDVVALIMDDYEHYAS